MDADLKKKIKSFIKYGTVSVMRLPGRVIYDIHSMNKKFTTTIDCDWTSKNISIYINTRCALSTNFRKNIETTVGFNDFSELMQMCEKSLFRQNTTDQFKQHTR